ncbi:MAG: gliding motility-associated C-terminal domain-containing protein, partial [Bacteroidota bacterium]|nr:gliding motility-associated C-terminal domain-containing protein [Bacteroidota bacterium]
LDPTADTTFVSPSFDETYVLEIADDIGSLQCLNRDTLQLEVNYLPDVTILPIGPFVCEGVPYVLDAFSDEAVSYQWLLDPALDSSQGNQAFITPIGTNWYTVIASNIHGCENSDSIFLPVQFPVSVDVVSDTALCIGSELILDAIGAETYQWTEASLDLSQDATLVYPVTGSTSITVVGSNACFDDTVVISVTGLDLPLVNAGNDTTIFRNTQAELFGDGEGVLAWIDNSSILNPGSLSIDVEPLENTTYILSSLGGNGCENFDSVTVFVEGKNALYLPTAFSPNGDGVNDFFHIIATLNLTQILDFSIWNRSGGLMFSTSDINDIGWDGRFKGKEQPLGVYVWSIQALSYDGEIVSYKGNVTLTR